MRKRILQVLAIVCAAYPAIASAQAPKNAVFVTDEDIKAVLKYAADTKRTTPDNTLKVIDMGTYQLGVAVVRRGALAPANSAVRGTGAAAPAANQAGRGAAPAQPACGEQRAGANGPNGIFHN